MFIETFYQTGTSFLSTLKCSSGVSFVCLNICNFEKKKSYKKDVKNTKKKQKKRREKKHYYIIVTSGVESNKNASSVRW